jgi:hypothetical protein
VGARNAGDGSSSASSECSLRLRTGWEQTYPRTESDRGLGRTRLSFPRKRGGAMFEALGLLAAKNGNVHTILWVIAVVLVVAGIIAILRRSIIFGIVLIIAGFLVGPGGVSIFK